MLGLGLGFGYTGLQGGFYTEPIGDQGGDKRVSARLVPVSVSVSVRLLGSTIRDY